MKILLILFYSMIFSHDLFAVEVTGAVPTGNLSADVKWMLNDTGGDALASLIRFKPNAQAPNCSRLSFIQIAKVTDEDGKNHDWQEMGGQANRNFMLTQDGYFIDHDASQCSEGRSCSPFYRDSWENPDESSDGESTSTTKKTASMFDAPYGWALFAKIELEACAVCQDGANLKILGCVQWGGKWPAMEDRKILPIKINTQSTPTFIEALKRFKKFYSR